MNSELIVIEIGNFKLNCLFYLMEILIYAVLRVSNEKSSMDLKGAEIIYGTKNRFTDPFEFPL